MLMRNFSFRNFPEKLKHESDVTFQTFNRIKSLKTDVLPYTWKFPEGKFSNEHFGVSIFEIPLISVVINMLPEQDFPSACNTYPVAHIHTRCPAPLGIHR